MLGKEFRSYMEDCEAIVLHGKTYFFKEGDFYDFYWHDNNASKSYPHLNPQPQFEEYEFKDAGSELEEHHKTWEEITLPLLITEDGRELGPIEVAELYGCDDHLCIGASEYRDFTEEAYFDY